MTVQDSLSFKPLTLNDFDRFYDLHCKTFSEHVINSGLKWDPERDLPYFQNIFNPKTMREIFWNGTSVGFVDIASFPQEVILSLLRIDPLYQNKGIGTSVIKRIMDEASSQEKDLTLDVLIGNRVYHLYERLGFEREEGEKEVLRYYRYPYKPSLKLANI